MFIQTLPNFGVNGLLRGGLIALDDDGIEPLGWEATGNWSSGAFFDKEVKRLSTLTGITLDRARALLQQTVIEARRSMGVPNQWREDGPPKPPRQNPVILTTNRYMRDIADDSWGIIQAANQTPQFFMLGNVICDVISRRVKDNTGNVSSVLGTRVLSYTAFRERLDRLIDYTRFDKAGNEVPARPPKDVVESMLAQPYPPVFPLQGIARGPVCAADGTVVVKEGYDPATQLYIALGDLKVPPVPDSPTDHDIKQARKLLLGEMLIDFPFVSDADRAHAVSPLFTSVGRDLIPGPTPLHMFEAPTPGSGKDLLADAVSYVVTGAPIPAMSEGRDDDEWRKRIFAKMLESPPFLLLDNIKRRLDSGALSSALERPIIEDRYLGLSKTISVPVRCTWIATANNPSLSDEVARRTARARIDSKMENPSERTGFRHPALIQWIKGNRGELLWAVLTLIRAWVSKGKPKGKGVMGSYEGWVATVGGILEVAGIPGFLGNRGEVYAQARAQNEGLRALVDAWWEDYADPDNPTSTKVVEVGMLFNLAKAKRLLTELRSGYESDQGARVALGKMMADMRDRVIGDFRIKQVGQSRTGVLTYQLELMQEPAAGVVGRENPRLSPASQAKSHSSAWDAGDTVLESPASKPSDLVPQEPDFISEFCLLPGIAGDFPDLALKTDKILAAWDAQGQPSIELGPGEVVTNLRKALSGPVDPQRLAKICTALGRNIEGTGG